MVDGMDGNAEARTVLVVEDDEVLREQTVRALGNRGLIATGAADGEIALQLARADSPELALVDMRMPGMGGLEVVRELHAIDPTTKIVVLTGYGSIATALDAVRLGATHYLTKPAEVDEILAAFDREGTPDADAEPSYEPPSLARVEWEHINRVLADCGGNISKAARVLKLHRRSLQRKLAKYPPNR
jgi:two-component system response regulator RegA